MNAHAFIEFLVASQVIRFGSFTLKSGRQAPYFINTGMINNGRTIETIGDFYAQWLISKKLDHTDLIFGPAYKGIPLAVATSIALSKKIGRDVGFTFDRKEEKTHGDKGAFVGYPLTPGTKIVLVEDVVTAGTTLNAILPRLRNELGLNVLGVIVAVDRCERGAGDLTATAEAEKTHGVPIFPLVTVYDLQQWMEEKGEGIVPPEALPAMKEYLSTYGAKHG